MVSRVGPNLFKPGGSESSEMPFDRICLDAGHGMSNRTPGVFDPGADAGGVREAGVALDWALAPSSTFRWSFARLCS